MVFFRSGSCDLDAAAESLAACGLNVTHKHDHLSVARDGNLQFHIRLIAGPHVQAEAAEIGDGTPHATAMQECNSRFEVTFDDLDAVLDEINTLMEIQGALQDASQGFLFLPWNGSLSEPWQE